MNATSHKKSFSPAVDGVGYPYSIQREGVVFFLKYQQWSADPPRLLYDFLQKVYEHREGIYFVFPLGKSSTCLRFDILRLMTSILCHILSNMLRFFLRHYQAHCRPRKAWSYYVNRA